ncbi:Kinesin-like protein KIN-14G [Sesamum alatum]|uniref:Kinesin-like protein KIN-14G n=1 Tax=Sesamum alatum TaxID=300844 RepID=A0AAE2CJL2_9LAMI|nr:Kinesin-like protein KIN-14G [Sesamum alatum]
MAEGVLQFNVESMVENLLQQHGKRLHDIDLASRKAQEASLRRYEAAGWLRKMVGVVAARDLPAEPSEEHFRVGLQSGMILCNVLNKVHPGALAKVVEAPSDTVIIPDGASPSAYQKVRNFLAAIEEMGIPTFEVSDLEQGGKSSRVVNCILALRSYHEWKQCGGNGLWKFSGNAKALMDRKNSDPSVNIVSSTSAGENLDSLSSGENTCGDLGEDFDEVDTSNTLQILVRELLSDKNREDIPVIVEQMLTRVVEEFEQRLASVKEQVRTTSQHEGVLSSHETVEIEIPNKMKEESCSEMEIPNEMKEESCSEMEIPNEMKEESCSEMEVPNEMEEESCSEKEIHNEKKEESCSEMEIPNKMQEESCSVTDCDNGVSKDPFLKHHEFVECQQKSIQSLKNMLHSAKEDMRMLQLKHQEEFNNLGKHMNTLAHAASGYKKVLEENRKLYNQVQDLKGNIRVYCRIRPFLPGQASRLNPVEDVDDRTIEIATTSKHGKGKKSFTFNKVFGPSAKQEEVFADTQPLIRSVLDGYNVCIFAYGQTGSGKTHTMTGPKELTQESMGVNYRALNDLFQITEQRKDTISYDISVQMIEIYNEQVRDLLATDDVINLMNLGHKNRAVGSTAMNDRSSRSHSCLTVHVQGKDLTSGAVLRGCMHLVDLAGSERLDKTEAVGDRLKEAQHINKSLSALGDVIASLAQKQTHVPYRNSKLTQLLQDSLGGQAKTLMFVHISPEHDALGETLSTLKFAERVSTVELGAARTNKDNTDVKELKEQIANLKAALARKEGGESEALQHSQPSSPDPQRLRSSGSSPSHSSWNSPGDSYKAEEQTNSSSPSRRHSLDPQDLMNSPSWPPLGSSPSLTENFKGVSRDWVDKVLMNKPNSLSGDTDLGKWEEEGTKSSEIFYQKRTHNTSKVHPEQSPSKIPERRRHSLDNGLARTKYAQVAIDDSDDHEVATSDSSEPDNQSQINILKSSSLPNVIGSKLRKPSPKSTRSQEPRSLIPPPTRKASTGVQSSLQKNVRQPTSSVARRKPIGGSKNSTSKSVTLG